MATEHVCRRICHSPAHHHATNEKLVKLLAALLAERPAAPGSAGHGLGEGPAFSSVTA